MEKVEWIEIGDRHDDFIGSTADGYSLRVERMDRKRWWWAVYYKHEEIENAAAIDWSTTARGAKRRATNCMKRHGNSRSKMC